MVTTFEKNNQTQEEYQESYLNGARAIAHIYAKSNESLNIHLRWKSGSGIAKDLSGYKAIMCVRERKDGHIIAAQCDTSGEAQGLITTDFAGNIRITMPYQVLQSLYKSGSWKYDLVLTSPDPENISTRLIEGEFYIDRSVSYQDEMA